MTASEKEQSFQLRKLTLTLIAERLGYGHYDSSTQISAVLQFQHEHGLSLKSDQPLETMAQQVSSGFRDPIDNDDIEHVRPSDCTFEVHTQGQTITLGKLSHRYGTKLAFDRFSIDGVEMYVVDYEDENFTSMYCDTSDVYADAEELDLLLRSSIGGLPPYADTEGEFYAPELVLAMELHKALRMQTEFNPKWSMFKQVQEWLKKHRPNIRFSDAQTNRLSSIIGSRKIAPNLNKSSNYKRLHR